MKTHHYQATIQWTGNLGQGTTHYKDYNRNHTITATHKTQPILASSDPAFLGDQIRYNPEELLLSSIASCHMLWYLHLCATNNIIVVNYTDQPEGTMEENANGSGQFANVTLHPKVIVKNADMIQKANQLHHDANSMCFIARSCNFPITHNASAEASPGTD
ncbi:OsmC family protein [Olleya namhaensis]|uniref:Organic hydroperoxide reductase OsmC/OhrA n=1 Tax=Olleya namhaensis TaxID=1144750 RepID=A0A1I3J4Y5_9FLAO|nr:OsmC family protein [Olleya namhaensis]SFI55249.1 Organic hydroperoxide reductase OsmC/OhrA [Olleya namhaensis]